WPYPARRTGATLETPVPAQPERGRPVSRPRPARSARRREFAEAACEQLCAPSVTSRTARCIVGCRVPACAEPPCLRSSPSLKGLGPQNVTGWTRETVQEFFVWIGCAGWLASVAEIVGRGERR